MPRRTVSIVFSTVALFIAAASSAAAQTLGAGDVSLRPGASGRLSGSWTRIADSTAAGGAAVWLPDAGAGKITTALAHPSSHVEIAFEAQAGIPYRLWVRLRAQNNDWANDSVFVQFSGAVDAASAPMYRIGTTSAAEVNLEACKGCGISGWGWQDNGWGSGVLGPAIYFQATGPQVLRIQSREDGAIIDQVLLSPALYMSSAPGALKNDTTILPQSDGGAAPAVTLVRGPYIQQAGDHSARVVWATREAGAAEVRYTPAAGAGASTSGTSRRVGAATTGLPYDYYHHEAVLAGLTPSTTYDYTAYVAEHEVARGRFRSAPATGTGRVRFIAFGDSGTGSASQQQLASVMAADAFDLALHTGDIAYGNSSGTGDATHQRYDEWFFDIYKAWLPNRAFSPSEGNHDSRPSNGDGAAYLDLFSLPRNGMSASYPDHAERYYSYDYGPVHFVALDTEFAFQDPARRAEQLAWLADDLAATSQPWKVAYFHRSPYSSGGEHGSDLAVRSAFGPLFERFGVRLVLSAHEHIYERSRPQNESGAGSSVVYVVTGGGGGPLYAASTGPSTAYAASRHHYVRAVADECSLTVEAVGLTGSVFDSVSLARCGGATREIVLYASDADVRSGAWGLVSESSAAGGKALRHPNTGAAKLAAAQATPANYFELSFSAEAGVPYRLWMRGRADSNYWANDSVFVQFSGSVTGTGASNWRIGTTSATVVNLEDCSGCGISGWGWQDNGYGAGILGSVVYFAQTGTQRIRVQTREDGLTIDQVVLSPDRYFTSSPGALKNDTTVIVK